MTEPAGPGDPDLTCEVEGIVIDSVSSIGPDFVLHLSGGIGRWFDSDRGTWANQLTNVTMELELHLVPADQAAAELHLPRWANSKQPLHLAYAAGRDGTLRPYGSDGPVVVLPHTPFPKAGT